MNLFERLYQHLTNPHLGHFTVFSISAILSVLIGRYTANLLNLVLSVFLRKQPTEFYSDFIKSNKFNINRAGTFMLLYCSWCWLTQYEKSLEWLDFAIDLVFMVFTVWLLSYLFRQFTRLYGVNLFRTIGGEITEVLLAVDTVFSIAVGLVAVTIFSHQHGIPLRGILAGVSIGGLALSFAAQNTLEQLFGTVVLLLDKPFIQGEYIRLPDGEFGRVESVGLRSTKIRTAGKNTLLIVPNSKMADWKIENVTRGRKVMILIYMDFERFLGEYEKSLVCQTVNKYIDSFFGIEPNTSSVTFLNHPEKSLSRARVTFFILGSTKNSIELRKRVTEISKTQLLAELQHHGLNFTANEPVISVDSTIAL